MPIFAVRFKGMLNKLEIERLDRAGITIEGQEPSLQIGTVRTGVPIYTVHAEAESEQAGAAEGPRSARPGHRQLLQLGNQPGLTAVSKLLVFLF